MNTTKALRNWCYKYPPNLYEVSCDLCGGTNTTWSEFEGEIWCYDCQKDTIGNPGIFDGPICIEAMKLILAPDCFDRIDFETGRIIPYDDYMKAGQSVRDLRDHKNGHEALQDNDS